MLYLVMQQVVPVRFGHGRVGKGNILDVDIPDIELEGERRDCCSIGGSEAARLLI